MSDTPNDTSQTADPVLQLNLVMTALLQTKDKYISALESESVLLKQKAFSLEAQVNQMSLDIKRLKDINQMAIDTIQGKKVNLPVGALGASPAASNLYGAAAIRTGG